jgi:hypothetical protein
MPIFLKQVKRELARDAESVGTNPDGSLRARVPTVISRRLGDYTRLRILRLDRSVHINLRAVDFTSLVASETTPGRRYRVAIRWHNIFMAGKTGTPATNAVQVVAGKHTGKTAYYKTPTISMNPVRVVCSCNDFRHRFSHELDAHDALIGEPLPYTRVTPPWEQGGRPYANATEKVGICKHVYSLIIHLKQRGLITER